MRNHSAVLLLFSLWFFAGCGDDATAPADNLRPETRLFVGNVSAPQSSRVSVHWQGDDPDGVIAGYVFSWNGQSWHFTTKNDSTFSLHISSNDSSYTFAVAAVDNSLKSYPAEGAAVNFSDANSNGYFDDGEVFPALAGAVDLSPARTRFPIRNSPPEIYFGADTTVQAARLVELPDTTFPVATFQFNLFDIDGAESIDSVEFALNDTTAAGSWKAVSPKSNFFTVAAKDGLREGDHNKLFLRATDVGGLKSKTLTYPPEQKQWFVRRVAGTLLLVRDETSGEAAEFFRGALTTVSGGEFAGKFDVFDIGSDKRTARSKRLPPFINPMLTESFKLYKAIIWAADARPTFAVAQETLPQYLANGGKALFCTELPEIMPPDSQTVIADFAPLDSVSRSEVVSDPLALKNGAEIIAEAGFDYPNLVKNKGAIAVHELYPNITARPLFRLQESPKWAGKPVVGVISETGNFIFLNLPLHYLNGSGTAEEFLRRALKIQFGL